MRENKKAYRVAVYGLLVALAFILSYIEAMIPVPLPVPGMKLGLANLVTVVGLYTIGIGGTVAVSFVRIILVGFTFGNISSMMYALAGWGVSILVMSLAKRFQWFSPIGVSVLGGICHNIGQLSIAAWITGTVGVFTYLPFLLIAGVVAGCVVGMLGGIIATRVHLRDF